MTAQPETVALIWAKEVDAARAWDYATNRKGLHAFRAMADRKNLRHRDSETRSRNGNRLQEYLVNAWPAEIQARYHAQRSAGASQQQALVLPGSARLQASPARLLNEKETTFALTEQKWIADMIDYDNGRAVRLSTGLIARSLNEVVDDRSKANAADYLAFRQCEKQEKGLKRLLPNDPEHALWKKMWDLWQKYDPQKRRGLADFARVPNKYKGSSKVFDANQEMADFVRHKYLNERLSPQLVFEAMQKQYPRVQCGINTLRRFLAKVPQPLKTYAHKGPRAWDSKHAPVVLRDLRSIQPMDWWVLDDRIIDVDCRNTLFAELQPDEMYRIQFSAIVDFGSLAWVGFCLSPQSSWRTVASALRMGFCDFGFPKNLYWDNGENFKKVQRVLQGTQDEGQFGEVMRAFLKTNGIDIGVTRALPYNARAKMIEPMFSGMSRRFDLLWGSAYQGRSVEQRTEYNQMAQKAHAKYLRRQREGVASQSPLPSDVEVMAGLSQWMVRENNRPRKSLGGRTPFQTLEHALSQSKREPIDPRLLDVLFSERDRRIVQRGGTVRLDNRIYEPVDASLGALAGYEKQEIIIARDPYALEDAAAYDAETMRFVGELRLQEFIAQCPGGHVTRDQIKAAMRRTSAARKMCSNTLAFLAAMASAQGWKTQRETLLEEAGLRTGTDNRPALPASGVPGAMQPKRIAAVADTRQQLAPAFVSDAAPLTPEMLAQIQEVED